MRASSSSPACLPGSAQGRQRKLTTGDEGARILVTGGTPGKVYEPPEWTEEGGSLPPMPEKAEAAPATESGQA